MNNMLSHHPNYVHSRGPGQWTFANLGSGNFGASVIIIDEGYEVIAEDDTGEFVYDTDFGGERFCPTKAEIFAALDEIGRAHV